MYGCERLAEITFRSMIEQVVRLSNVLMVHDGSTDAVPYLFLRRHASADPLVSPRFQLSGAQNAGSREWWNDFVALRWAEGTERFRRLSSVAPLATVMDPVVRYGVIHRSNVSARDDERVTRCAIAVCDK